MSEDWRPPVVFTNKITPGAALSLHRDAVASCDQPDGLVLARENEAAICGAVRSETVKAVAAAFTVVPRSRSGGLGLSPFGR
jgi:hypothetical protein